MKFFARLSLMGSGLGLIFLTATPSFATVTGVLNTGGNGTVTVTPTGITFTENDTAGGSTEVGVGTTLTYSGGSLTVGQPVTSEAVWKSRRPRCRLPFRFPTSRASASRWIHSAPVARTPIAPD